MNDLIGRGGGGGGGGGHRGGGGGGHRGGGGGGHRGGHHHHHQPFYGGGYGYGYGAPYYYEDPWWLYEEPAPNLLVVKTDPQLTLPDEVPVAVVGAARDDLARMVAAHEVLWPRIARANPNHAGMRAFMLKIWNPWFQKWSLLSSAPMDAAAVTALMTDLARVRGLAKAQGIPLPALTAAPRPQPWRRDRPQYARPGYRPAQRKMGKAKSSGEVAIGRAEALASDQGDDEWISEGDGEWISEGEDDDLVALGALMAPGSRGLDVRFAIDDDCMLRASICVDGHCYEGAADLSDVLAAVDQRARGYHDRLHKESAIKTAGDLLVGRLLTEHEDVLVGAWWKKFKKGVKAATYGVHSKSSKFAAKYLKKPVTMAATAVATVYGGPIAGAAAAKFTGPLMDAAANDFKGKKAKALVDAAEQEAKTNPKVAEALKTAKKAIAHTAIAYTMTDTMKKAKAGDPEAKARIAELEEASSLGDFAAKQALAIMAQASAKEDEAAASEGGEEAEGGGSFWDKMRGQMSAQMGAPKTQSSGSFLPFLALAAAGGGAYAYSRHRDARKAQLVNAKADEALAIMNSAITNAKSDAARLAAAGATAAAAKITQTVSAAKKGDPAAVEMLVEVHTIAGRAPEIISNRARKYFGVSSSMIDKVIAAIKRDGGHTVGINPWNVITNKGGVELRATWSKDSGELLVEVTDSDLLVSYDRIWSEIDPKLRQAIASNASVQASKAA